VVDEATVDSSWIPIGRDTHLEQVILCRIAAGRPQPRIPPPAAPVVPSRP
jgi:hypothetical protein